MNATAVEHDLLRLLQDTLDAARAGDLATLGRHLDLGVPVDVRSQRGDSLLMLAAYRGHADAARLLLARGADPDLANDAGQRPLAGAAFQGARDVAAALIDGGAAVDGVDGGGRTALMFAAMFDRDELVALLLDRGADAGRADAAGLTALDLARSTGAARAAARLEALSSRPSSG